MIFVIPVSGADFDKLPKFIKVLKHFGGLRRHRAIFVPTKEVADGAKHFIKSIAEDFSSTEVVLVDTPIEGAWPYPCNQHFGSAVTVLQGMLDKEWMWLELDSCPLRAEWADDLQFQYQAKGRPFLGVLRKTDEVQQGAEGSHMVGFGIYPPNLPLYTSLWKYPSKEEPFDVFMRFDVSPHVYHTNLIAHFWGSREYQPDLSGLDHEGNQVAIPREAVIVHGVKDDSLFNIILGESKTPPPAPQLTEIAKEEEEVFTAKTLDEMAQLLRSRGYFVANPDVASSIIEPEDEITQIQAQQFSTQSDGLQGDPATAPSSALETKTAVDKPIATNVQLRKRGRPRKIP